MTTKKITLNLWDENEIFITAIQGESSSRFLEITLMDGTEKFDLTDKLVQIYLIKPDRKEIYNPVTILDAEKGLCEVELTSQMSNVYGVFNDCEIRIVNSNADILKIKGFKIAIEKGISNDYIESTNQFLALDKAMSNMININEHIDSDLNPHNITSEQIDAISITEKAQNNGVATLDSNGKLVQKPIPSEINAIDINQKGEANGIATLNANAKLQSSQLDTSLDAYKIKLTNLSEEVQSAMAGTAPVISSVEDGSLRSVKYADNSITNTKLGDKSAIQLINGFDGNIGNYILANPEGDPQHVNTGEWYYSLNYTGQKSNNVIKDEGQIIENQIREYNGFDPSFEDIDIPSGFGLTYIDPPKNMIKIGNQKAIKRNIPANDSSLRYLPIIIRPSDTSYGEGDVTLTTEFMLVPTESTEQTSATCTTFYASILDKDHNNYYKSGAVTYKISNIAFEFNKVYRLRQILKNTCANPTGIFFNMMFKNQPVSFDIIYSRLSFTKGAYPISEIPLTKNEKFENLITDESITYNKLDSEVKSLMNTPITKTDKEIIAPPAIYVTSNDILGLTFQTFSHARQYSTSLYLDHMIESTNDNNMIFSSYPNQEGDKYYFVASAYNSGNNLIVNNGENINISNKTVSIKSDKYNISSKTVVQRSTKTSISKNIYPKVLFLGDSITYAVGANPGNAGNAELPFWAYTKKFFEMDRIDGGNNSNEYNFMSLGRASNLDIPINYNGIETIVKGSSEGWSGCMLANHLHHAGGVRPDQSSWDLLGLGDGTGKDYIGSDEQKSLWAITNQNTTSTPSNPFFDNSKTGNVKFSISKWLERYRTYDDSGNQLTLSSSNLGTSITTQSQLDKYHVCTPTHII